MIIECSACNSRFRLDESKITGRGARVRCRKCGEPITVMKEAAEPQGEAAAPAAEQSEGLDLRSILRETMETPLSQAAAPEAGATEAGGAEAGGVDTLQSDFEKMLAEAGKEADAEAAAPVQASQAAPPAPEPAAAPGPTVDFGPEEEITFLAPAPDAPPPAAAPPKEPARPAAAAAAPKRLQAPPPDAPAAPAPSSEFMMSTADSLDFLKADYDKGETKADLDISGNLRVAPAAEATGTKTAPPMGTQAPVQPPAPPPPSRSAAIQSELAGLGGLAAAGAAGGAKPAAAPPTAPPPPKAAPAPPGPEPAAIKPAQPLRRTAPGKRPALKRGEGSRLVRPSVVLLLLLFFALAGGGAYLGFTSDGQKVLRGLVPQIESLWLGGGKPASRYEVANLIGYYETGAASAKMFVIKGQVTNEGTAHKVGARVYAALLDAQGKTLAEKTIYAGTVFAGETLRQAARDKIEAAMSNPISGGLAGIDLPPGKAVQFMVVFFDAPDGIDSYRVEPRDVE